MTTSVDPQAILSTRNLIDVGVQADDVRRQMHGTRTTFVRVLNIEAKEHSHNLVVDSKATVGEFRLVGRPSSDSAAIEITRMVAGVAKTHVASARAAAPVTGFSIADLLELTADLASFTHLCRRLRDAGLDGIAEVAVDTSDGIADAIAAARDAGLGVWRLTVQSMPNDQPGAPDPRIAVVDRARALQNVVGGLRTFAPLPRTMSIATPTTGYDDVKLVALARLVVTNIESIQVDWPLYGPKLAQVALTMGADDVDGVSAVDPGLLGMRRSPIEEIKGNIRAAGLEAVERDGRFELIG
jgi:CofH/MqnC C-terminal region